MLLKKVKQRKLDATGLNEEKLIQFVNADYSTVIK